MENILKIYPFIVISKLRLETFTTTAQFSEQKQKFSVSISWQSGEGLASVWALNSLEKKKDVNGNISASLMSLEGGSAMKEITCSEKREKIIFSFVNRFDGGEMKKQFPRQRKGWKTRKKKKLCWF